MLPLPSYAAAASKHAASSQNLPINVQREPLLTGTFTNTQQELILQFSIPVNTSNTKVDILANVVSSTNSTMARTTVYF